MPFNSNERALFEVGARAMAEGGPEPDVSLALMNEPFYTPGAVPEFLAATVEQLTDGKRSVREADCALFASKIMGIFAYMVVCDGSTRSGKVTELTEDMRLVGAGPYQPGFEFDLKPALPEAVKSYREHVDKSRRKREEADQAKEDTEIFLVNITSRARSLALQTQNTEAIEYIDSLTHPKLTDAARAYRMLGTSIQDILADDSQ